MAASTAHRLSINTHQLANGLPRILGANLWPTTAGTRSNESGGGVHVCGGGDVYGVLCCLLLLLLLFWGEGSQPIGHKCENTSHVLFQETTHVHTPASRNYISVAPLQRSRHAAPTDRASLRLLHGHGARRRRPQGASCWSLPLALWWSVLAARTCTYRKVQVVCLMQRLLHGHGARQRCQASRHVLVSAAGTPVESACHQDEAPGTWYLGTSLHLY